MRKIIFLDIDGVLNQSGLISHKQTVPFDSTCVQNLMDLYHRADVDGVVVSSSWRLGRTVTVVKDHLFEPNGVHVNVLGMTPHLHKERGFEVEAWLNEQSEEFNYIILDDYGDMVHLSYRLIRTDSQIGLTSDDVERALNLFETLPID